MFGLSQTDMAFVLMSAGTTLLGVSLIIWSLACTTRDALKPVVLTVRKEK